MTRKVFRHSGSVDDATSPDAGRPAIPLAPYRDKEVEVVRPVTPEEADIEDIGPMWVVRADDGTEFHVFDDELE